MLNKPDIELIRFTTAGSVDDGKSTLIGRLLYDTGSLYKDQIDTIVELSAKRNFDGFDFSLVTDGLTAEREQGITIDVAYRYFSTKKRHFIIADTPGHEQHTRNMITGMSNADVAIILVDASCGILEQAKRHLLIISLLGVSHILVAVSKMDLVDYDQNVFNKIQKDFLEFVSKLTIKDVQFVPISALKGDMVVKRGVNMTWWHGQTVLEYLENIYIGSVKNQVHFRLPVQYVICGNGNDFRGYAGTVESGFIEEKEEVIVLPSGRSAIVDSILTYDGKLKRANAMDAVVLTIDRHLDISRGDMLVKKADMPFIANEFEAIVCWMSNEPLLKDRAYFLKHTTKNVRCFIKDIHYRINIDDLRIEDASELRLNQIGKVHIISHEPLILDTYDRNRTTGSCIIINEFSCDTVGAVMVLDRAGITELERKVGLLT